jgi:formylglycine-generating enzyme required for sulfatase activity
MLRRPASFLSTVAALLVAAGCDDKDARARPIEGPAPSAASSAPAPPATAAPAASPAIALPEKSRIAPPVVDDSGACPSDMARIYGTCVDRYEAPNIAGEWPLVMESAVSAEAWCDKRGKRLCAEDEWEHACQGPQGWAYPYGDAHETARCADEKAWIDKDESTIVMWPEKPAMGEVTRLYQASKSGTYDGCVSGYGVHDMTGNVEEWVVGDPKRHHAYEHVLKGCYWSGCYGGSKPVCTSTNAAHADTFKFYETGFRCCRDARVK